MAFLVDTVKDLIGVESPEAKGLADQFGKTSEAYKAYRPQVNEARSQAFSQAMNALAPANNMLGQMYGQGAMQDLGAAGQNFLGGLGAPPPAVAGAAGPTQPTPPPTGVPGSRGVGAGVTPFGRGTAAGVAPHGRGVDPPPRGRR